MQLETGSLPEVVQSFEKKMLASGWLHGLVSLLKYACGDRPNHRLKARRKLASSVLRGKLPAFFWQDHDLPNRFDLFVL
jgi:hypothetical protein